jgi:hypothetical protein
MLVPGRSFTDAAASMSDGDDTQKPNPCPLAKPMADVAIACGSKGQSDCMGYTALWMSSHRDESEIFVPD